MHARKWTQNFFHSTSTAAKYIFSSLLAFHINTRLLNLKKRKDEEEKMMNQIKLLMIAASVCVWVSCCKNMIQIVFFSNNFPNKFPLLHSSSFIHFGWMGGSCIDFVCLYFLIKWWLKFSCIFPTFVLYFSSLSLQMIKKDENTKINISYR